MTSEHRGGHWTFVIHDETYSVTEAELIDFLVRLRRHGEGAEAQAARPVALDLWDDLHIG